MRTVFPAVVFAALVGLALAACPGAQVKPPIPLGDVQVVVRRIDVVKGGYDKLDVAVVLAVTNGTGNDLDVGADLDVALLGEARSSDDGSDDGSGDEGAGDDGGDEGGAAEASAASAPAEAVGGSRASGQAGGVARAQNTSELLVPISLPLPADAQVLERVLGWSRSRVGVQGKVRIGLVERAIAGERDLATPRLPELRLKNPQIARADEGAGGEAFITLLVDNKNTFAVTIDKLSWDIAIAGKSLRTKEDGATHLQPSSVEEYESIVIDESAFPAKVLKALLKKPSVPYVITGSLEVRGIRRDFHFNGEMQFPR